jgi:hypothetical protein
MVIIFNYDLYSVLINQSIFFSVHMILVTNINDYTLIFSSKNSPYE